MDDDQIKELFNKFEPELSSSFQFMSRLQKNMTTMEFVKHHNLILKKRNKLAVIIAATCGIIVGIILTLLFPLIDNWISTFSITIPHVQICNVTINYSVIALIIMACVCIITTLNAYEIAIAKLTPKDSNIA